LFVNSFVNKFNFFRKERSISSIIHSFVNTTAKYAKLIYSINIIKPFLQQNKQNKSIIGRHL